MCAWSLKFPVTVIWLHVAQCSTAPLVHGYQTHGPGQPVSISATTGAGAAVAASSGAP
ncbi:hypothetical protein CCUG62472_01628 [Mycobacteroides salmoniphilum]|nr:hypothetical protein CCUG62472_01628 [Mycobacteroides salmoniphilum]